MLTTIFFLRDLVHGSGTVVGDQRAFHRPDRRSGSGSPCSSPTSPRPWPKAAARPRPTPSGACAPRPRRSASLRDRPTLRAGRRRRAAAGRSSCWSRPAIHPGDGEVVEGVASVDESAITGESAPVIRESGGDRSAVTGGTRVISDRLKVRITAEPRLDLPRPHDRAGRRRRAAEDAERDRAQHPAGRAHASSSSSPRSASRAFATYAGGRGLGRGAGGALRLPDPDDDRRPALRHRHRRHGPPGAASTCSPCRAARSRRRATSTRCCSTRPAPSPSATAWRPSSSRCPASTMRGLADAAQLVLARRRDAGRPLDRRARQGEIRHPQPRDARAQRARSSRSPRRPA